METSILNNVDYDICETQQNIFEYAVQAGYDLKSFAEAYLGSSFCRRAFDTLYSRFQIADAEECADFFMPEIEKQLVKSTSKCDYDSVAGDVGFMYRLLYIKTGIPSKELLKIIPFEDMAKKALNFDHYGFEESADELIEKYLDK